MRFIFPIRFKWMRNDAQQFYREKGEGDGERRRDLESNSVMSRINPNIESGLIHGPIAAKGGCDSDRREMLLHIGNANSIFIFVI